MKKVLASVIAFGLPVLASAQSFDYFQRLLGQFKGLLNTLVVILISLAVVFFIWNVFKYIMAGDAVEKGKATTGMISGIVGLAVIVSIWGLVTLLKSVFGVGQGDQVQLNNLLPGQQ